MASTYLDLHVHVVFATKHRQPWIKPDWLSPLHAYLGGTIRNLGATPVAIGGTADHVHMLIGIKSTHTVADLVKEAKRSSTIWIRNEMNLPPFAWQEGYAAFTVSSDARNSVISYIQNQESHHRDRSALNELEEMLREAGVTFDPQYLD